MLTVYYIALFFANIINLTKLNNIEWYWDYETWILYNTKMPENLLLVRYILK